MVLYHGTVVRLYHGTVVPWYDTVPYGHGTMRAYRMRAVHHGNVMRTVPNIVTNIAALYYSCIAGFLNDPIFSTQDPKYCDEYCSFVLQLYSRFSE